MKTKIAHPAKNILVSLPQECRDLLAESLNKAFPEDLEALPGIGPHKLSILLNSQEMDLYGLTVEDLRVRPLEEPIELPKFTATRSGVTFERQVPHPLYRTTFIHNEDITTRVFNTRKSLLALLKRFDIPLEYDVNDQIVELRDIRARLSFIKEMDDPVVQAYLRSIGKELLQTTHGTTP